MPLISLVVTQRALDHANAGNQSQRQIAIRAPSSDIQPRISQLSARHRAKLRLGGCVNLVAGDPGAIWGAHNQAYAEDFDALFDLLARRPGVEMRFLCELE